MKSLRNNDFSDRRSAAADAKATLLQVYRAAKEAAEPTRIARQQERLAIAATREARRSERERLKREEQDRVLAAAAEERAAVEAAANELIEARQKAEKSRVSRVVDDEAARKAERDRRYASRKERQR